MAKGGEGPGSSEQDKTKVSMRLYADLHGLDFDELAGVIDGHWPDQARPLSLAFSQTAQVPGVRRDAWAGGTQFAVTGAFPTVKTIPAARTPIGLRLAVWSTALLVALAVAGLAADQWKPQWMAALHLIKPVPATPAQNAA
ncbi:MAG: hypothetical protein ACYDD6_12670, partial [Acidimicrobiales bacterium]